MLIFVKMTAAMLPRVFRPFPTRMIPWDPELQETY